jgi:hypothetical protein
MVRSNSSAISMAMFAAIVAPLLLAPAICRAADPPAGTAMKALEPPKATAPAAAPAAKAIEPAAMAALNKMGAYLRSLKTFQVSAATSTDGVTDDGQVIANDAVTDLLAQMPNRLRVEVTSDDQHRFYFFDGKNLTVWGERVNYYATVPAPPTIAQLADLLYEKYDINMPLEDLFLWGTPHSDANSITAARDFGPSQILGVTCQQYAFRQPGLDWQIWIQNGAYPLPRKLVLTTTSDPARPRYTSILTWNLAPSFDEGAFTFNPPKDAHRIVLAESRQEAGGKQK